METKLAESNLFIDQIDGRLNSLVANINLNPVKNLDKLEVIDIYWYFLQLLLFIFKLLKSDIDEYESEIRNLLTNYDMMTKQDQLDNSGQIENQVKSLQNKFENIQEEISILIAQMKQLLTVKMQLSSCCETIKSWIGEVDKQINLIDMYQSTNTEERKQELQVKIILKS